MSSILTILKEATWVTLTALVLAAGAYALRPSPMVPGSGGVPEEGTELTGDIVPVIDLASAVDYFTKGAAVFADARSDAAYSAGHIEGALNLDPHQFDVWSEQVFSQIEADAVIITYCDGERCTLGFELAEKLAWLGYENVRYLKDGWSRWTDAQLPVEKGGPNSQ
jgi:rhodanese-related sulfurtransferase